ncbi:Aminotransferase [Dissulfuribacter thermophilus]|uniref:Aminotransferase n=1 Tax=Dissulfuribacter thermophilus TaxID=1156395 RepID=A0A1B9F4A4_9BACT|nr:DegT/DnrJ/EryC1/StrS family aminotransferase [Dissulfuribacter thermophilus]OCC14654.1 Aminotransferase [Dissulfuribacter thermophilus]
MSNFLPFALPLIGPDEFAEVSEVLHSGWLTTGHKTAEFEKDFAAFVVAKHALAVNSATAGLHLALEAIGVGPGDKVVTTPYTFTATAEVIRYLDAEPIFVDIEAGTFNIDPTELEKALVSIDGIKAVIPVHFGGQACDMDPILEICRRVGVAVVEDAAHALPTTYRGKMVGSLGDLTVFSFYVTKPITTGEGGMVVTDNEAYAARIKTMRLHGINKDVFDRYTANKPSWYYEVVAPGYKYNMTDIAAAIGIHQLKKAYDFQRRRQWIAEQYSAAFKGLPLRPPVVARPEDIHAWHLYVIQLELENLTISRDRFIELMAEAGIGTSVHFIPLHLHPYWRERYKLKPDDFPVAYDVYRRAVSLPIYPRMRDSDVERVINTVNAILTKYSL